MPLDVFDRLLRPLRTGRATIRYPDAPASLPARARGAPELDGARCDGSGQCVDACPTDAISLGPSSWTLDLGACVFCGACASACPQDAITIGGVFELAVRDRESLRVERVRERRP